VLLPRLLLALSATALLTACAGPIPITPAASALPATPSQALPEGTSAGTFRPADQGGAAITYDPAVVPAGATAEVVITKKPKSVTVRLSVTGMVPRRAYGAHLHTQPCTAAPAAAGPHYEHVHEPATAVSPPAGDPRYANPRNEVWLDFTADAQGAGSAVAAQGWSFDETNPPRSLIVHAEVTRTGKGEAGTAGPRVACLTLAPR
jgi:Cu-Zn family superoxide dismutase